MTIVDEEGKIPLPLGSKLDRRTVSAHPIISLHSDDLKVVEKTGSGWPTIITGSDDGEKFGIAIDYMGAWHDSTDIDEIDILLDGDGQWWSFVAYNRPQWAQEEPRHTRGEYEGFEMIPWRTYHEEGLQLVFDTVEEKKSPILYDENRPVRGAIVVRMETSIDQLVKVFGLDRFQTLMDRQERMYRLVVPPEERWSEERLAQMEQLGAIYESVTEQEDRLP